jgi:ribosomal protein L18
MTRKKNKERRKGKKETKKRKLVTIDSEHRLSISRCVHCVQMITESVKCWYEKLAVASGT